MRRHMQTASPTREMLSAMEAELPIPSTPRFDHTHAYDGCPQGDKEARARTRLRTDTVVRRELWACMNKCFHETSPLPGFLPGIIDCIGEYMEENR